MSECPHNKISPYDGFCDDCGATRSDVIADLKAKIGELEGKLEAAESALGGKISVVHGDNG